MAKRAKLQASPAALALKALRKKWLLWSLLPVLLVLAALAYLVYYMGWNAFGVSKYKDADFPNAVYGFEHTIHTLPMDQWIYHFNMGTARIAGGAYSKGIEELEVAETKAPALKEGADHSAQSREDAPPMCKIRTNHVLGYKFIGNDAFEAADPYWNAYIAAIQGADATDDRARYDELIKDAELQAADAIVHYEEALAAYETSLTLLAEFKCPDFEQLTAEIEEIRDTTKVRLETLKNPEYPPAPKAPEEEPDQENPDEQPEPSEGGSGGESPEPQDPDSTEEPSQSPEETDGNDNESNAERDAEAQRRELLEERNKQGQQERETLEGQLGGGGGSGRQW